MTPSGPLPPLGWAKSPSLWLFFIEAFPKLNFMKIEEVKDVVTDIMIILYAQVELKIESVKNRLDDSGQIKKNDFIEFSIEAKLLDLTDSTNARKTLEGTPKKSIKKGKEEWTRKLDTDTQVKLFKFCDQLQLHCFLNKLSLCSANLSVRSGMACLIYF